MEWEYHDWPPLHDSARMCWEVAGRPTTEVNHDVRMLESIALFCIAMILSAYAAIN